MYSVWNAMAPPPTRGLCWKVVDQLLARDAACIGLIQTADQDRVDARRPVHTVQTRVRTSVVHPPHVWHVARSASKKSSVGFVPAQASAAPRGTVAWNLKRRPCVGPSAANSTWASA